MASYIVTGLLNKIVAMSSGLPPALTLGPQEVVFPSPHHVWSYDLVFAVGLER